MTTLRILAAALVLSVVSSHQSQLHGDTLIEAQRGSNLLKQFALTEKGDVVHGVGDPMPNVHDMVIGSQTDGRAMTDSADRTRNNWTSSGAGSAHDHRNVSQVPVHGESQEVAIRQTAVADGRLPWRLCRAIVRKLR